MVKLTCAICGTEFENPVPKATCCDECRDKYQKLKHMEYCRDYYPFIEAIIKSNPDLKILDKRYLFDKFRYTFFQGTSLSKYRILCKVINAFAKEHNFEEVNRFIFNIPQDFRDQLELNGTNEGEASG